MTDKIIFFGKNYQDHMLELGDKPVDKPVIFLKPPSILRICKNWGKSLQLCFPIDEEIHYECELVFKLVSGGSNLTHEQAKNALGFYTVGLDMTKRKLQRSLKDNGHPWEIGKIFQDAAVIGPWIALNNLDDCLTQPFSFTLNNCLKQSGYGRDMLFSPVDLLVYASHFFPLCENDIVFTGTPSGVGKISQGDTATITIGGKNYHTVWS